MGTVRQELIDLLREEAMTARDLSQAAGVSEKDVYRHLVHIQKSMAGLKGRLLVTPSSCLTCGFTFTKRSRLTKPGKCPRCRDTRIASPVFRIH